GPGRDLDIAGHVWIFQLHADIAAGFAELFEQAAADSGFDFHGSVGERLVAAACADGEGAKLQRLDFFPRGAAEGFHLLVGGASHGVIRDAGNALDAFDGFLDRGALAETHEEAVAGLLDARHGDAPKRLAERREELAEKETAICAFQPKLMIVDDDGGVRHAGVSCAARGCRSLKVYSGAPGSARRCRLWP